MIGIVRKAFGREYYSFEDRHKRIGIEFGLRNDGDIYDRTAKPNRIVSKFES